MKNLELLAPAGSYDSLVAAINAGADAVYIGGSRFGARAYAENPGKDQLLAGLDYAHLRGRKVYLTVNTLLKDQELDELYDYLKAPYESGLDAVIVQDLGVLRFVKELFPDLPIHASTQMNITGPGGFQWLKQQGVTRIVPARELSLKELEYIHKNSPLEIEAFIHGALCYCYSGQCLLSSILGGRSGNRGRCAQPCRLPYTYVSKDSKRKPEYLLSPKDLSTLDLIPELIEAGVTSFKIEGRMKRPEYAAGVVEIYRKALDAYFDPSIVITPEDRTQLWNLYSRGGNCQGYLKTHNDRSMITLSSPSYRTGEESLFQRINRDYLQKRYPLKIQGKCRIKHGHPSFLTITYENISVQVQGDSPDFAKNQPMDSLSIKKRLCKTGETDFLFTDLSVDLEDGLFLSIQSINSLRRKGLDLLKEAILEKKQRTARAFSQSFAANPKDILNDTLKVPSVEPDKDSSFHVLVTSLDQAEVLLDFPEVTEVYLDSVSFSLQGDLAPYQDMVLRLKKAGKSVFLALPHIFRQQLENKFQKRFCDIFLKELSGCLIRNWETYLFLENRLPKYLPEISYQIRSDSNLYAFNSLSKQILLEQNFEKITLPVELNQKELESLADQNTEWIVYSYLPLMISAQCIRNTTEGCTGTSGMATIKDRLKKDFHVRNYCDGCYNIIYNSTPMILWDKIGQSKKRSKSSCRLDFHFESPGTLRMILEEAVSNLQSPKQPEGTFTRGHFTRGVE